MFVDFIANGRAEGPVAEALLGCRFDPGFLRPYINENGERCVTVNVGQRFDKEKNRFEPVYEEKPIAELINNGITHPVFNATTLRKDEWIQLDTVVLKAARQRLRAWADLAAANTYSGFNGMSKMVLEHETMSDPGEAVVDMDGLSEGRNDVAQYQLEGLPLPIVHADFWFSKRRLAVSRNTGTPLDTTMGEAAGRRVAEMIERMTIGTINALSYGDSSRYGRTAAVYGYRNFPARITKSDMVAPDGTNGQQVLDSWLALRDLLYNAKFYGPFMAYVSTDYDRYLDNEFKTNSDKTLRQRLKEIDGIIDIRRLDFLTNSGEVLFVQMTPDVARAVIGMDITTVQWEEKGGLRLNFKVMAIMVPQLRADFYGNCGIAHGTTV